MQCIAGRPAWQKRAQKCARLGHAQERDIYGPLSLNDPDLQFDPQQVPYFVNRTRVIATKLPGMALWREKLYTVLRRNAASPVDFFCLPPGRVFEIGTSVEL